VNIVMVQYYTLEEAAKVLQTTPDKLKAMAKKNEVRAFQDRGNLRFRSQEIDELARSRGLGSDPELPLGEAPKSSPPSAPRRKSKIAPDEPIAFVEDDEAPIGREPSSAGGKGGPPSSSRKSGMGSKVGRKPTMAQPGPKSPPPKAASDSDVRLVAEGSDLDFQVTPEEPKARPPGGSTSSTKGAKTRASKLGRNPDAESGVRIVPLDEGSDSDVKLSPDSGIGESALAGPSSGKKSSDSDIRLEDSSKNVKRSSKLKKGDHPITEEIDLDEEEQRADAAARTQGGQGRIRPKPNPLNLPTSSPFELSEADIKMDEPPTKAPRPRPSKLAPKKDDTDSSSDFELTPIGGADPSPLELSSGESKALNADDSDEVTLGELTGSGAARSGINLQDPADSGISLEQGGSDEIEFELSLDAGATPKPSKVDRSAESSSEFELAVDGGSEEESSSEFELALDSGDAATGEEESSSEFELSLDADDSGESSAEQPDSDSEFELTLDADGGLQESDETDALAGDDDEKDIFETDFEVPALEEEESGSEAVVLEGEDTDLETSDFDLALDEEGSSEEDAESGSQVVALGDEEADEGAETAARPRKRRAAVAEDDEESELDLELDPTAESEEDEEEEVAVGAAAAAPPARWGMLPALLMLPSVVVMFVVGLLAFELAGTQWNYRQPGRTTGFGLVLHPIAKYFDSSLPD
jgi:excisionase family DNA binding protein